MGEFDSQTLEQRNYLGFVVFTSERSLSLPNCVVNTSILIFRGTPSTFHIQIPNIDSKYQIQKLDPCKAQIVSLRFQYRCEVRWDGAVGIQGIVSTSIKWPRIGGTRLTIQLHWTSSRTFSSCHISLIMGELVKEKSERQICILHRERKRENL